MNAAPCYWQHTSEEALTFACHDGRSRVCARCCVERCPQEAPGWFADCAAAGHPTWPARMRTGARPPAKLVVLESYWNQRVFQPLSVKGVLDAFAAMARPPVAVAHRFVESERGLDYYLRRPGGLVPSDPSARDAPIVYLAFHGAPGQVFSVLDAIGRERLCTAFAGYGENPVLVYFAACNVLRGRRGAAFGREFLQASGARAVVGYTTPVAWVDSMLTDLAFLQRFYTSPDPWAELPALAASLRREHALARRLGWTMMRPLAD